MRRELWDFVTEFMPVFRTGMSGLEVACLIALVVVMGRIYWECRNDDEVVPND